MPVKAAQSDSIFLIEWAQLMTQQPYSYMCNKKEMRTHVLEKTQEGLQKIRFRWQNPETTQIPSSNRMGK